MSSVIPLLKWRHQQEFFEEYLEADQPILDYLINNFMESNSGLLEQGVEKLTEMLFQPNEYKNIKSIFQLIDKKWKSVFENR